MDFTAFLPILFLLLFIPIFLSGRKQKKQMQEMQQMQAAIADGDVVMTTSGLRATVVDASYEDTLDLEIAPGVVTTWVRVAIRERVEPEAGAGEGSSTGAEVGETPGVDPRGGRAIS